MKIIPAIDLMKGNVVRLSRGDPTSAKVYNKWGNPIQVAQKWKDEGATRIHIIDLDAAFNDGDNTPIIANIVQESGLPLQVGGGIRTMEAAERLFKLGVNYVILGALAFSDPEAIPRIQQEFGADRVIIALDNKNGKVMVEGWKTQTAFTLKEALEKFFRLGARSFLMTSITKDGMLQGPDLEPLREAVKHPGLEIIAAGGITTLNDLVQLKEVGVKGAVVGKALYEGRFTLKQAILAMERR